MLKNMKRFALMLCVLVLCVSMLATVAFAAETATAHIPVKITLSGTLPEEPETFVIQLTPEKATNPMPEGTVDGVYTTEIVGEGAALIEIDYDKTGEYNYTVTQLAGSNENCTYCTDVYRITVFVTNSENGGLDATVVAYCNDADEKSEIIFPNEYADPDYVTIKVIKTMDGKTPADGAFSFVLIDEDGNAVTVQNVGKDVVFPEMTFDEEGTYEFTLKEVIGNDETIGYDESVYKVVIEVVKNEEGDFEATVTYYKNGKAITGVPEFANVTINPEIPETGDSNMVFFFAGAMVLAAAAILVVLLKMKRQKRDEI